MRRAAICSDLRQVSGHLSALRENGTGDSCAVFPRNSSGPTNEVSDTTSRWSGRPRRPTFTLTPRRQNAVRPLSLLADPAPLAGS